MLITSTRAWAIAAHYARGRKRQCGARGVVLLSSLFALAGCAARPADRPVALTTQPWTWNGAAGTEVRTAHYRLLTTVPDEAVVRRFLRVMETAYLHYTQLLPPRGSVGHPLEVVLMARPEEWEAYTRTLTGRDAAVYLSVGPGGYAYGDRFVCWLFNESDLWGVAAHEGFHQYAARHLTLRLPPALEEGLATTFETVAVSDSRVDIDRQVNARRQRGLSEAAAANALLPLNDLLRLHAGDVAGQALLIREGFYGQCWALARVIVEHPAYADGLRRMLADLRIGTASDIVGRNGSEALFFPAAIRPLLSKYIATDWSAFERTFQAALARFANDDRRGE